MPVRTRFERTEIEQEEEWHEWSHDLPFLSFPSEWQIQIIPPFGGAMIRFKIRRDDSPEDRCVSVYFDAYSRLGSMPYPYWEVYPLPSEHMPSGDDVRRHAKDETNDLLSTIDEALDHIASTPDEG